MCLQLSSTIFGENEDTSMRKLPLTNNMFALIDDQYFNEISEVKWNAKRIKNVWYGIRSIKTAHGHTSEMLHRAIYELAFGKIPTGQQVRFKTKDKLDCRIKNLTMTKKYLKSLENK